MSTSPHLVLVVDDDLSVRCALERLLRSLGLQAESFARASEVLDCDHLASAACFILDIHLPDITGWELAEELVAQGARSPVIFITANLEGHRPPTAVKAPTVLLKPFDAEELVVALQDALGPAWELGGAG